MADVKISQLPAATSPVASTDVLPVVQGGDTKKASIAQLGFLQAGTGGQTRTIQDKLRDVVSVKDFGAVGDNVTDDTAAIQAAIDSGKLAIVPPGTYKVTDSLVIGPSEELHLDAGATIYGVMPTARPVIRVAGNFASLTGTGYPIVRCDHQTGWLLRSFDEGVINIGPSTLGGGANINWARVDGIRVIGNNTVYNQYSAGTNTNIDKYIGIKMVHGRYTASGSTSTSLYNTTVANCMIEAVGVGIDMDPVVQGNNFINNYFYFVSFAGYRGRGTGENTFTQGFYHSSPGVSFFRFETVPLRIDNASGTFVANEVVTGGTSGATLTLYPNFPYDSTEGGLYGVASGTFAVGETVTGGVSGATAIVSTTRQVYIDGSLGRASLGNSCVNVIGEPGATATIGTQNAGPVGGRHSRFYTVLDGCTGNVFQGRANTGHVALNYGASNVEIEQGLIVSQRDATFANITATTGIATPIISVGTTPLESAVEVLDLNTIKKHYASSDVLDSAQKTRFTFLCAVTGGRRSALIKIAASGQRAASNTASQHPAAVYLFRVLTDSSGNSTIQGPTAVYEYTYVAATHFVFASGSGNREYTIELANPTANNAVEFFYEVEILGRDMNLTSVSTV